ncbi:oxidoreductase [Nocardioides mangrovicus]|uniref:Oxidoreductase n=1 Tax=Nocardioides mangrovicus TaxID=2478913 RepID=A0A3L8P1H9_9ACTN|nr:oxidoreductase [Nocardioides mangrovicus]RLV48459.1 oxidoreductase [Nocardioides mangrovicus]
MPDPAPDTLARLTSLEGVPSAFAATRDGIDALLRDRGLRRTTPEQTADSLLRGAHASAELSDGSVDAAVRISAELLSLVPVLKRAPLQVLARLDVLAGGSGRPATPEAAARMGDLAQTLLAPTTAPALLVAAVAHAEIATVAPFGTADGLVARAVERLLLVARGVDPASLVVPEAGHLALRAEYESNLRGYATGGRAGLHAWLLYAAEAQARGAEESPLRG